MPYDTSFYESYKKYLLEPSVRQAHDWIFEICGLNAHYRKVVDLGCGVCQEFDYYTQPEKYFGVDLNVDDCYLKGLGREITVRKYNSRNRNLWNELPFKPTAFVSLFSLEITATAYDNYYFYDEIFSNNENIKAGLVSGFYYFNKKNENPVEEVGGIFSFQSLDSPEDFVSKWFVEKRIILPVPSKMFGEDVYEVWKFFDRK